MFLGILVFWGVTSIRPDCGNITNKEECVENEELNCKWIDNGCKDESSYCNADCFTRDYNLSLPATRCPAGCYQLPAAGAFNCRFHCVPYYLEDDILGICKPILCEERQFNVTAYEAGVSTAVCDYHNGTNDYTRDCYYFYNDSTNVGKCVSNCPTFYKQNDDTRKCELEECSPTLLKTTTSLPCGENCYLRYDHMSGYGYTCVSEDSCRNDGGVAENGICNINCSEPSANCLLDEEQTGDSALHTNKKKLHNQNEYVWVPSCKNTYEYKIESCFDNTYCNALASDNCPVGCKPNSNGCIANDLCHKCVNVKNVCGERFASGEKIYPCGRKCHSFPNFTCTEVCGNGYEEEFLASYSIDKAGRYVYTSIPSGKCVEACKAEKKENTTYPCGSQCYSYGDTCVLTCPPNAPPQGDRTCNTSVQCRERHPVHGAEKGRECMLWEVGLGGGTLTKVDCVVMDGECFETSQNYSVPGGTVAPVDDCSTLDQYYVVTNFREKACELVACEDRTPHDLDDMSGKTCMANLPEGVDDRGCFVFDDGTSTTCVSRCPENYRDLGSNHTCVWVNVEDKVITPSDPGCWTGSVQYLNICIRDHCPHHTTLLPNLNACALKECEEREEVTDDSPLYCNSSEYAALCLPCGPKCYLFVPDTKPDLGYTQPARHCDALCALPREAFLRRDDTTGLCVNATCAGRVPVVDDRYPCGRYGENGSEAKEDRCYQDMYINVTDFSTKLLPTCVGEGGSAEETAHHRDFIVYNSATGKVEKRACVDFNTKVCGPLCLWDVPSQKCVEKCAHFTTEDSTNHEQRSCDFINNCTLRTPIFTENTTKVCGLDCVLNGSVCIRPPCDPENNEYIDDGSICKPNPDSLTNTLVPDDSRMDITTTVTIILTIGCVLLIAIVVVVFIVIAYCMFRVRKKKQVAYEQSLQIEDEKQMQEKHRRAKEEQERLDAMADGDNGKRQEMLSVHEEDEEEYSFFDLASWQRGEVRQKKKKKAADKERRQQEMETAQAALDSAGARREKEEEDDAANIVAAPTPKPGRPPPSGFPTAKTRPLLFGQNKAASTAPKMATRPGGGRPSDSDSDSDMDPLRANKGGRPNTSTNVYANHSPNWGTPANTTIDTNTNAGTMRAPRGISSISSGSGGGGGGVSANADGMFDFEAMTEQDSI